MGISDVKAGGAYVELYAKDALLQRDLARATTAITRWGGGIASSLGLALGGFQFGSFLKGAVARAGEAESSQLRLAAAMKTTGQLTNDAFDSAVRFAHEMSIGTRYTREQVEEVMALGASLGNLSGTALHDATRAAIGWGQTMGVDAADAMRSMIAAANGSRDVFKRYGIELGQFSTVQDKLNFLIRESAGGFEMHRALMSGTSGAIAQAAKSYDELKTNIGEAFIETVNLSGAMGDAGRRMAEMKSGARDVGTFAGGIAQTAGSLVRTIWSGLSGTVKGLTGGAAMLFGQQQFGGSLIREAAGDYGKIGESWKSTLAGTGGMNPREMEAYLRARGVDQKQIGNIMSHYGRSGRYIGAPAVPNVGVREMPETPDVAGAMISATAVPGMPRGAAAGPVGILTVQLTDEQLSRIAARNALQVAP